MNIVRTALAAALVVVLAAACESNDSLNTPTRSPRSATTPAPSTTGNVIKPTPTPSTTGTAIKPLPFNAGGLLAGTASPSFPGGEAGEVSVVQIGEPFPGGLADTTKLPFAFRNNTGAAIASVEWTGTARSGGSLVATGSSRGTVPAEVQPGEIGLAFILFGSGAKIPPGHVDYVLTVKTSPVNKAAMSRAPLKVTEANVSGDAIVGTAVNASGKPVTYPISADVYCFDGDKMLTQGGDIAEQLGPVAPGGQATFSVDLHGRYCPAFTVGVEGLYGR